MCSELAPSSPVIRSALPDEADALADVQREASLAALAHIFPPARYPYPIDEVRRRWQHALGDGEADVFVADEEDTAVGVALVRPEWLDGLYVVPGRWGTGLAPRLLDAALSRLRERGSERCQLWVLEENHRARRFYERLGWRENGMTRVVPFPPNPLDVGYSIAL